MFDDDVPMEAVYPSLSREWWLQMEQSLSKLAGTYTGRSLFGRAFRGLAAMCGRRAVHARPAL